VSKPRFWGILPLQGIDFIRPHFQKIDFSHSLAPGSARFGVDSTPDPFPLPA
jgi:hypothetical protein